MTSSADLFSCDLWAVDPAAVERFVRNAIEASVQAESVVLEFKAKRDGSNVVEAVAALSNTDGGLVLVGVDEKRDPPMVGVPSQRVDQIVQSLRQLPLYAMPEVVPIALRDEDDRVVVVIRVNTEGLDTPVVLHGRVLVRVPGHTVGADRDQILSLYRRSGGSSTGLGRAIPLDVSNVAMWDDERAKPALEARVHAAATLPRRAERRQWIGSAAYEEVHDYLDQVDAFSRLLAAHARNQELQPVSWRAVDKAANRYRFTSTTRPSPYRGAPTVDGSVLITKSGRQLDVVVAIGLRASDEDHGPFLGDGIGEVRETLLAASLTAVAVLRTTAASADVHDPLSARFIRPWLGGSAGLQLINLHERWNATSTRQQRPDWLWGPSPVSSFGVAEIRTTVDEWMTQLLLDLGATGFESDIQALAPPPWHRSADEDAQA